MNINKEKVVTVLTKEGATKPLNFIQSNNHLDRLVLIQKTLNDIEERLTHIENRLDK